MASKRVPPKPAARPAASDASLERAHGAFRDGDVGGALAIASQILSRDPVNPDALLLASQCHSLQGRFDRAVAFDRRAVEAHPENPQAWMTLAFYHAKVGDAAAAVADMANADKFGASDVKSRFMKVQALALLGKKEEALAHLEKASAESPEYREEAKSQPEFAALLEDPRFLRIVSGAKDSDDPYADWMRSKT